MRRLWNIFIDWVADKIDVNIDPDLTAAAKAEPPSDQSRAAEKDLAQAHLIYLSRRPSAMHTALLVRVLSRAGLPVPRGTLSLTGEGHFRRSRYPRIVIRSYLRPRRGSESFWPSRRHHRVRLQHYLDDISQYDRRRRLALIPFAVFTGRGSRLIHKDSVALFDFDYFPMLDMLRIVLFALFRDRVQLRIGAPFFPERDEPAAGALRKISRRIYGWEKLVQAARSPSHESLSRVVLSGPRYEKVARDLSLQESASLFTIHGRAERILYGMAARFHSLIIGFLYLILRRVLPRMFTIRIDGLEGLKRQIGETPVVVIPSHRSHADYIILSYLFFTGGLPLPHVAAGDNLNFWPIGRMLRAGGAFFIRRRIDRDDRLYKTVLDLYLTVLLKQGSVIEFFIEGGRSRSGTMLPPRFGLLKYLVRAYLQGQREDLAFVPVSIAYDRLPEERALIGEQAGARKERESAFQLFRIIPGLRRSFGAVTVVVGDPIPISGIDGSRSRAAGDGTETLSTNELTANIGNKISQKIQSGMVLTPRSLLSLVLADLDRRGAGVSEIRTEQIAGRIAGLFELLAAAAGNIREDSEPASEQADEPAGPRALTCLFPLLPLGVSDSLAAAFEHDSWDQAMSALTKGIAEEGADIAELDDATGKFRPGEGSALRRDYYRNTIISHLINPLFYLLAGQAGQAAAAGGDLAGYQRQVVQKLHHLFTPICLLPDWPIWAADFNRAGGRFEIMGLIERGTLPAESDFDDIGSWKIGRQSLDKFGYLLWTIRPLLEAVKSALAVSSGLPEEGISEEKFNGRVRNGAIQVVTTSMLGWARDFLIGEGVLQKIVMDRDASGPRVLGLVSADKEIGQSLFQLLRQLLSNPREKAEQ